MSCGCTQILTWHYTEHFGVGATFIIFIGNMKRRVDAVSPVRNRIVIPMMSSHMSVILCRFNGHPCEVGTLVGATSCGQVYAWAASKEHCDRLLFLLVTYC